MTDFTTSADLVSGSHDTAILGVPGSEGPRPNPRLQSLARHGRQAEERSKGLGMASWADDLSHLSESRRAAWCRVISSVASTEGLEATVMEPLIEGKKREGGEVYEYLAVHANDERRHHELLTGYLRGTFGFEKKAKTLSDRIFYDKVLPGIASSFLHKPLYGFALLYCYERFATLFYAPLRERAQADGAQNLLSLIQSIEKDELRHVAGMEYLLKEEIRRQGGLKWGDLKAVSAMLAVLLVDLDMSALAIHNREIREKLVTLGIDPQSVTEMGRRMRRETLDLMVAAAGGVNHGANGRESD